MTLAFYSFPASYYVRLTAVERLGQKITVRYRFVPHRSVEATVHFALIPLGILSAGEYEVNYVADQFDNEDIKAGFMPVEDKKKLRLVCQRFRFSLWEAPPPAPELEDDAVVIPLDKIGALSMSGAGDLRELDEQGTDDVTVPQIVRTLEPFNRIDAQPESAFPVLGIGTNALREAHAVRVNHQRPRRTIPEGHDISLVFFAHREAVGVELHRVSRRQNIIEVRFREVPRRGGYADGTLALIPFGKLPVGEYRVEIVRSPMNQKLLDQGFKHWPPKAFKGFVCHSSSFTVSLPGEGEENGLGDDRRD